MAASPQVWVHGRARRRIVAMGGIFAERFQSPGSKELAAQDKFLAVLLRNGVITDEQLGQAIDAYRRNPQDYAWMLRFRHTVLDKAEKVFFVRHGRYPTENTDFPLNGDYYEICRTLHYDPQCFDEELKKLVWDVEGKPRIVETPPRVLEDVQRVESKKGSAWTFALILFASLASAITVPLLIISSPVRDLGPAGLVGGFCWMALLACALIATRPRRFETNVANYMCSVCRGQLDSGSPDSCRNCRIRFR